MSDDERTHIEHADALDEVIVGLHNDLHAVTAERDHLQDILKLTYFHLGPAAFSPHGDYAVIPAMVRLVADERDRLRDENKRLRAIVDALPVLVEQTVRVLPHSVGRELAADPDTIGDAVAAALAAIRAEERTVTPEELGNPDWYAENTVEIGGEVMTQAQYDAARFPLIGERDLLQDSLAVEQQNAKALQGYFDLAVDNAIKAEAENKRLRAVGQRQALQTLSDEGQYEENYQARLAADTELDRLRAVVRKIVATTGAALEGENDECLSYASDGEYASAHGFTPDEMAAYRAALDATPTGEGT